MSTIVEDKAQTISGSDLCVDCGHCCRSFWINKATRDAKGDKINFSGRNKKWLNEDIKQITADEAIALGLLNHTPQEIKALLEENPTTSIYRCSLYDNETKCCTDYENRPVGCSQFPSYVQTGKNPYKDCALYDQLKAAGEL